MRAGLRFAFVCWGAALGAFGFAAHVQAQPEQDEPRKAASPPPEEESRKEEARGHFERALSLFDAENWDAALAEFLLSRKLYWSRPASLNVARSLQRLKRYDEALDEFEALASLPDASAEERQFVQREIESLKLLVGSLSIHCEEPGVTIAIDGRIRGTTPLKGPLRVSIGSRIVRAAKSGFTTFENRVEIAGGENARLEAELSPLVSSGWLKVEEENHRTMDVVVDGALMGRTPWKGLVQPGDHVVYLRNDGRLGTQPTKTTVRTNQVTAMLLSAEMLSATLVVDPLPADASVRIDGIEVSKGIWAGGLRPGLHRVEVLSVGFLPQVREVTLKGDAKTLLNVALERDAGPPLWWVEARTLLDVSVGVGSIPSFGGAIANSCTSPCASSAPLSVALTGRYGFRFSSGLLLGVEAGYLFAEESFRGRVTSVKATGIDEPNRGAVDDTLTFRGYRLGLSSGYRLLESPMLTGRFGVGLVSGSVEDRRTGSFATVARPGVAASGYQVDLSQVQSAPAFYMAPGLSVGYSLSPRVSLSAGLEGMLLILSKTPQWVEEQGYVLAGPDGQGKFAADTMTGSVLFSVLGSVSAHFEP